MTPQVEAAWIAAGSALLGVLVGIAGTTIVAIAGFRNARDAADRTLLAARGDRLWARKADAYQDALTASLKRSAILRHLTFKALSDEEYDQAVITAHYHCFTTSHSPQWPAA
jgi:hypothetical protein